MALSATTGVAGAESPEHLAALDGLRALAIALVLLHNFELEPTLVSLPGRVLGLVSSLGWVGVQLFFVLSGFLITRQLLSTQRATNYYGSFFGRRVLRIFPLYFGTLLMLTVLWPALGGRPLAAPGDSALWLWLFLSNWTEPLGFGTGGLPHFWSLAVEEQFYLVWPFLVRRRSPLGLLQLCLIIAVASVAWRAMAWALHWPPMTNYTWTPARLDALALGAAIAALFALPRRPTWLTPRHAGRWMAGAVALAILGYLVTRGYVRLSPLGQIVGYTVLAVVFTLALTAAVIAPANPGPAWARALRHQSLQAIGRYSFAMYIFHKPLHDFIGLPLARASGLERAGIAGALVYTGLASLITFGLARLSYHHVEQRFLALKPHFAPRT